MRTFSLSAAGALLVVTCFLVASLAVAHRTDAGRQPAAGRAGHIPQRAHATVAGDLIFVPGTLGTKPGASEVVPGGAGPQTVQALRNIEQQLSQTGAELRDVVKCTDYLIDLSTVAAVDAAYRSLFAQRAPARTTVGVASLAQRAAVQIECIATRPKAIASSQPIERTKAFVQSSGEQIYYETAGRGDAVVLCHGAGGNHIIWYQQVPVLAQSYRVITWDQRGYGSSTNAAEAAGPASSVADLRVLLDRLGIRRAHLVGHSMGGWAALGFAIAYPERVRSLILADTIAGIHTPEIEKAVEAYLQKTAEAPSSDDLPLGRHPALDERFVRRDPAAAFLYQELSLLHEMPLMGGLRQKHTTYDADVLAQLTLPVLFIVGSEDPIFPPALVRAAAALVPHARVVEIPGAGHSPYFEQADAWNRVVLPFLRAAG